MDSLWSDIDDDVLGVLETEGAMDPADLGRKLGVSADAASSWVCNLVMQGEGAHQAGRAGALTPLRVDRISSLGPRSGAVLVS
jgi:hypothetical protein